MDPLQLVKESSERSDASNWAKRLLANQGFAMEALEGCNQNKAHQVSHLMERARCNRLPALSEHQQLFEAICQTEGYSSIIRKTAFCRRFGLPLHYIVYGQDARTGQFVQCYQLSNSGLHLTNSMNSYQQFAQWIQSVKGWYSNSAFGHQADLPLFDQILRQHGTPWPANIDCFLCNEQQQAIAIIEFQNVHKSSLSQHCNNNYFWGLTHKDDQRRWFSQEILRVQSGLPYIIITWSQREKGYILKRIAHICFPAQSAPLKGKLRQLARKRVLNTGNLSARQLYSEICAQYSSRVLTFADGAVRETTCKPPLSYEAQSFPMLYYSFKHVELEHPSNLPQILKQALA
jgi:hypothetical protein